MSCHLPPAVPPQPSLGCASCNFNQPATCSHQLGPGLGGEPQAHRPALGAAPLGLVLLTKSCLFPAQCKAGRRSQTMLQQGRGSISCGAHTWGGERCSDLGPVEPSSYNTGNTAHTYRENEQKQELRHPQKNQPSFYHYHISGKFRSPGRRIKVHRHSRKKHHLPRKSGTQWDVKQLTQS